MLDASAPLVTRYGRPFAQGQTLFREGDRAPEAYFLHRGRVRLLKRIRTTERSVCVLASGDLFGEGALVDGAMERTSTAVALTDGVALAIDLAALRVVIDEHPLLAERIVAQLARRLRDAEDQVEVLMLRDTQSKVVCALLKMARAVTGGVELTVSPIELSSAVALDVESVKRVILRLREQHYVRIIDERIEIPDLDALRRLYALLGSKEELRG